MSQRTFRLRESLEFLNKESPDPFALFLGVRDAAELLQKRLLATDGIHSATVSLEPGQARIESDLETSAVEAIIREAGFKVPLPEI